MGYTLVACSSTKSGKYVRIGHPYNLNEISKIYSVSKSEIENFNMGKSFNNGDWIFVPGRGGIMSTSRSPSGNFTHNQSLLWPFRQSNIRISSDYGYRGFSHHDGLDLPAPRKSKIFAAASGVVVTSSRVKGYGKTVIIDHGAGLETLYAHNSSNLVNVGDRVQSGDPIALVGATGKATGNHLHFEVRINGEAKDPMDYLPDNKNLNFQ